MAKTMSDLKHRELALRAVLEKILRANDDFRAQLPDGWEGDPLQDACDEAKLVLNQTWRRGLPKC